MKTQYGDPVPLTNCDGDILPTNFGNLEERMAYIKEVKYKQGDILMAAWCKCGNHWMTSLIKGILEGTIKDTQRELYREQKLGWLFNALYEKDGYEAAIPPRVIPTHLKPNRIPPDFRQNRVKAILMLRNPKDAAVSYYHHLKNARVVQNKQTWEEFLDSYQTGMVPFGCYMDYLESWEAELGENKTIDVDYFYFEDFKTNGVEAMRKLAKHLGAQKDSSELEAILNDCTLSKLRDSDNQRTLYPGIQDEHGNSVIYRKGIIGDWKTMFTVEQNEKYDQYLQTRLKQSVFSFRYA